MDYMKGSTQRGYRQRSNGMDSFRENRIQRTQLRLQYKDATACAKEDITTNDAPCFLDF